MSGYGTNRSAGGGSGGGVTIYATLSLFPATAIDGTLAVAADTHIVYEYNTTAVAWQPIASNTAYLLALASSGAATSIGALDSQAANANGLALVANVLSTQSADATHPGMINTAAQSLPGAKTFIEPVTIGSSVTYAHTRYEPNGPLSGSNPAWEVGYRQGQPYFSIVEDDGSTKTTFVDFALNGIADFTAIVSANAMRANSISDIAGGAVMALDVIGQGLHVETNADDITLQIKGNGTQTSDIFQVVNSADAPLARINNSGNLILAGTATASNLSGTNTGDVTLAAVGSTPNANAASLSGQALTLQPADATNPGVITTVAQSIAGAKTFTSNIIGNLTGNASGSSGTFTGNLTGDVTSTGMSTTVAFVGASSAANVHSAELLANAATSANTANAIVKRGASGEFSAGVITGTTVNSGTPTLQTGGGLNIQTKGDGVYQGININSLSNTASMGLVQRDNGDFFMYNGGVVFQAQGALRGTGPIGALTEWDVNGSNVTTNILTPLTGSWARSSVTNSDNTVNNYSASIFANSSGQTTSALVGVHEVHTAGVGSGHLSIITANAGTSTERLRVAKDGILTASAYGAGIAQFSSAGVVSSATVPISLGGTGQTTKAAAFDALSPMTTGGDLIYGGASGTGARLPNGTAGYYLQSQGTTLAPTWVASSFTPTAPTVQSFLSSSGTYTRPTPAPLYISVEMVGGGGGGGGGNGGGTGGTGGNSTFGSALLVANGGGGGGTNTGNGTGGTASLGAGIGLAITGGSGDSSKAQTQLFAEGGAGGVTALGGGGGGGSPGVAGDAGATNTGGGGGGGGGVAASATNAGCGGGAGGYVKAIITSPASTYAYAVGAAGTGGTAGSGSLTGGAGGSGVIIVTEYYQ